jgi:rhodanese-related sulfurtransferase
MSLLDMVVRTAAGAMAAGATLLGVGPTWSGVDALIERRFPDVRWITTQELATRLGDPAQSAPLLLDARSDAEFAVSHLPGARHVDPDGDPEKALDAADPSRPIVVYCAVGYRSARVASRLQAAGHHDVRNLRGSIFRWAEEGRPLERDGRPVTRVHPYDAFWGRLLPPELHAEPAARTER